MRERERETDGDKASMVRSGSVEELSPGGGDVLGVWGGRVGRLSVLAVLGQFLARLQLVVIQELCDLDRGTKTGGVRVKEISP